MSVLRALVLFAIAAIAEIGGAWLVIMFAPPPQLTPSSTTLGDAAVDAALERLERLERSRDELVGSPGTLDIDKS